MCAAASRAANTPETRENRNASRTFSFLVHQFDWTGARSDWSDDRLDPRSFASRVPVAPIAVRSCVRSEEVMPLARSSERSSPSR